MRLRIALKVLLGLVGAAALAWFLVHADLPGVAKTLADLGWVTPALLAPYLLVYLADTLGWMFSFRVPLHLGFLTLLRIRWAGEAVNNVLPSAYLGGEALKVYLLGKRGVPSSRSAPAAVVSKTVQTLAQVICIALAGLGFVWLGVAPPVFQRSMLIVFVAGTALVAVLFWIQRKGIFGFLIGILRRLGWRKHWVDQREAAWRGFDRDVSEFYVQQPGRFLAATTSYLGGWVLDAVEIYFVAHLVGVPMNWIQALAIETFVSVAKTSGTFIPAAMGVQDSSVVFLCRMAGVPDSFGFTYAVLRRGRELVFVLLGWLWLVLEEASLKTLARRVAGHN